MSSHHTPRGRRRVQKFAFCGLLTWSVADANSWRARASCEYETGCNHNNPKTQSFPYDISQDSVIWQYLASNNPANLAKFQIIRIHYETHLDLIAMEISWSSLICWWNKGLWINPLCKKILNLNLSFVPYLPNNQCISTTRSIKSLQDDKSFFQISILYMDTIQAKYSKPILPTMQLCKTFRGGKKNLPRKKKERVQEHDGKWEMAI